MSNRLLVEDGRLVAWSDLALVWTDGRHGPSHYEAIPSGRASLEEPSSQCRQREQDEQVLPRSMVQGTNVQPFWQPRRQLTTGGDDTS